MLLNKHTHTHTHTHTHIHTSKAKANPFLVAAKQSNLPAGVPVRFSGTVS